MKDKQIPEEAAEKPRPKKPNIFLRLLAFLVTLALMLGAVTLVVYRDKVNFDSLKRWFTYRSLEKNESGQAESFSHYGSTKDAFVSAGSNLLTADRSGARLYSGSGTAYAEEQAPLENPVVSAAGPYSLAYDAGGARLFLFKDREMVFSYVLDGGRTLLSARVNPSGYLAVTTQAAGYKGSVLVFGPDYAPLLQLNLSSSFVMDAVISRDNASLAAVTIGEGSGGFESSLDIYSLDRLKSGGEPTPDSACPLGGNLALDLREFDGGFRVLGESALFLVGRDGALNGVYDYGGRYLKEFSLDGDGFSVALLGKYRAGTLSDLAVVDGQGALAASLPVNEQVLSLSAAGRYIAVLTADRLDVYTSDLTLYASLEGIQGARKVLMRSDGTALLISDGTARLFIPN